MISELDNIKSTSTQTKKISTIFIVIISVMLILSIAALFQVFESYRRGRLDTANLILSVSAVTISIYMLLQLRVKPLKLGFEPQKVLTTIECVSCGYKMTREFKAGDFMFKKVESCPQCNERMIISSIYKAPQQKS